MVFTEHSKNVFGLLLVFLMHNILHHFNSCPKYQIYHYQYHATSDVILVIGKNWQKS